MARLSPRVRSLERRAAGAAESACRCAGGGWDVLHARRPSPGERRRGLRFISPDGPAPPPRPCPACGRPRNQIVIRSVVRPLPRW